MTTARHYAIHLMRIIIKQNTLLETNIRIFTTSDFCIPAICPEIERVESMTINSTHMNPPSVNVDNPAMQNLRFVNPGGDWVKFAMYVKNSAAPLAEFYNIFLRVRNAAAIRIILKDKDNKNIDVLYVSSVVA